MILHFFLLKESGNITISLCQLYPTRQKDQNIREQQRPTWVKVTSLSLYWSQNDSQNQRYATRTFILTIFHFATNIRVAYVSLVSQLVLRELFSRRSSYQMGCWWVPPQERADVLKALLNPDLDFLKRYFFSSCDNNEMTSHTFPLFPAYLLKAEQKNC